MNTSCLALPFLFLPQVLMAQTASIPAPIADTLRGVYVLGNDCYAPETEHRVIASQADFLLLPRPNEGAREYMVTVYSSVPQLDDGRYVFDTADGYFELVSQTRDGGLDVTYNDLKEGAPKLTLEEVLKAPDKLTPSPDVDHYTRCDSFSDEVLLPYIELIPFLRSDVLSTCSHSNVQACIPGIFDYLDVHEDGELRPAEIARGLRIASMLSLGIDQANGTAKASQIGMVAGLMPTYPLLGMAVVGQFDYDGSGGVSLEESGADFGQLPGALSARVGLDGLKEGGASEALEALSGLAKLVMTR